MRDLTSRLGTSVRTIPAYAWGLIIFVLLAILILAMKERGYVNLKTEIDLFGMVGIPLFVVTVLELIRTHHLQAAELIRGHISPFLSNPDLHRAFHDLIYKYSDDDWKDKVYPLVSAEKRADRKSRSPEMTVKVWETLKGLNEDRQDGSRLYDPDYFQGSKEEERLDAVLHYFDVMAYNYVRGLISLRDIRGVAGYHLTVIGTREVTQYYLRQNVDFWHNLPYKKVVGSEPPFENLRTLLAALEKSNRRHFARKLRHEPAGGRQ